MSHSKPQNNATIPPEHESSDENWEMLTPTGRRHHHQQESQSLSTSIKNSNSGGASSNTTTTSLPLHHRRRAVAAEVASPTLLESSLLECPVCSEFPQPPIYICEKGHFTCTDCLELLTCCSLCQAPFTRSSRNFALESIIESSVFSCPNAGCSEFVKGYDLSKHVAESCDFRPLKCPFPDCSEHNLPPGNYLEHLVDVHGIRGSVQSTLNHEPAVAIIKQAAATTHHPPFYIQLTNEKSPSTPTTAILITTTRHRSFYCWHATSINPAKDNDDDDTTRLSSVRLTLSNPQNPSTHSITWTLPVHRLHTTFEMVRDSGTFYAVLPVTHIIPFYNNTEDEEWDVRVEVVSPPLLPQKKKNEKQVEEEDQSDRNCPREVVAKMLSHYLPLIIVVVVGLVAVAVSLLAEGGFHHHEWWFEANNNAGGLGSSHQQDNQNNSGSSTTASSSGDDQYFGYRGFYYKTG